MKFWFTQQAGWLPEMAIVTQTFIPTGSTQVNKGIDDDETFLLFAQSWTINYALNEQLGAYTEWFMLAPSGSHVVRTEHYFDGGFTYKFTPDIQWDIRSGVGLNDAATDFFVGTGLSVRFR